MRVETLFYNAHVFNAPYKKFLYGFIGVREGKIVLTGRGDPSATIEAINRVDLDGCYVVPGLIDIHTHIESVMLTPRALAGELARRGVTTIVSEPHEIANVAGMRGVREMIAAADGCPIDIYYGVPSSVPSTSAELETTGGVIGVQEVRELATEDGIQCLGEVMNARSIVNEPDGLARQIVRAFQEVAPHLPVEGHCPRLMGEDLCEFLAAGIDSDHTEHTPEELEARYFGGVLVQLQDKMIKPEVAQLLNDNPSLFERTALVTDDVMADELMEEGHLDYIVRRAIAVGFSPEMAVYCATKVPADRMRLYDRGDLRPGTLADFVVLDDVATFAVHSVYKSGRLLDEKEGRELCDGFSPATLDSVHVRPITPADFAVSCDADTAVRAIEVNAASTQTKEKHISLASRDGLLQWENTEARMIAVFERYGINENVGRGFICGAAHTRGAVATTYCHDHHNLMVGGASAQDMTLAANEVAASRGGICVVLDGEVLAKVELPVGGIMSADSAADTAHKVAAVTKAMRQLGYDHYDPIMSFCTLSLPVSPALKITDKGLVNTADGTIKSLFAEE